MRFHIAGRLREHVHALQLAFVFIEVRFGGDIDANRLTLDGTTSKARRPSLGISDQWRILGRDHMRGEALEGPTAAKSILVRGNILHAPLLELILGPLLRAANTRRY